MSKPLRLLALACTLAAWPCLPAAAQGAQEPPPGTAVFGPFWVTPTLMLKDAGVDNNVFNDATDPKSDFTFTLTPATSVVLRVRRLRTSFFIATDYVYFRKYTTERGMNVSSEARADLDLGAIQPYVSVSGASTRSRMNAEVDLRARHRDVTYGAGAAVRLTPTTRFVVNVKRLGTTFDPTAIFRGVSLDESFDGRRTSLDGGMSVEVTPVTTVNLVAAREQQTFDLTPDRNSTSWRIGPSLTFDPLGLITGTASVSYRRFSTVSPALPDFSGIVASVSVGATIYGRHSLQTQFSRDVQYSYDPNSPYFLGTGGSVTWTSLVAGPIDVRGTAGRQQMSYRTIGGDASGESGGDHVVTMGGGVGYRFSHHARLGINADWSRRNSTRSTSRDYSNHRVFASLSWGIVQ
jgi:putative beta-barrel porin BBP2